jgi:hypothetical protein
LEERTGECLECAGELRFATGELVVEADDADVFFAGALLGLDEAGGSVDADDEAAGDFGVEGAAVARLLDAVILSQYLRILYFMLNVRTAVFS